MVSIRAPAQALIWFTMAVPLFVSMTGLAIDGGMLLAERRQLQSVADGAARAGATRLNIQLLRSSGGTDVELDPTLAADAARGYLADALANGRLVSDGWDSKIDVAARRVSVVVEAKMNTAFLRIVRIEDVPVRASAFADVQYGIRTGAGT